MARDSVCGMAVPDCRESDFGPLAALEPGAIGRRAGTDGICAGQWRGIRGSGAAGTLFRLVDTLPAEQRRVVVLRFVEQKSIKEVAREIRKTEGAVKQLQFRALSSLRARMEGADA